MNPPDPASVYRQAVDALNRSDWPRAYALASSLLPRCDDHGGVHFVAGVAAVHQHDNHRAYAHLRRAVQLSPTRPDYSPSSRACCPAHGRCVRPWRLRDTR